MEEFKSKVIALVRRAHEEELAFVAALPEEEREEPGSYERWSARDVIGHNATWKQRWADRIMAMAGGESVEQYGDDDDENEGIFTQQKEWTWDQLLAAAARGTDALIACMEELPEDFLQEKQRFFGGEEHAIWERVLGNGLHHVTTHLATYHIERGRFEQGVGLMERVAGWMAAMDESEASHGTNLYNIACLYALEGRTDEALPRLRESLRLNPGLTEWSREDPDLVCLHGHAGYEALYA